MSVRTAQLPDTEPVTPTASRLSLLDASLLAAVALTALLLAADAGVQRVEVWTVDGAGTTGGLATAPDEWESRVTRFLTDQLLGNGQG